MQAVSRGCCEYESRVDELRSGLSFKRLHSECFLLVLPFLQCNMPFDSEHGGARPICFLCIPHPLLDQQHRHHLRVQGRVKLCTNPHARQNTPLLDRSWFIGALSMISWVHGRGSGSRPPVAILEQTTSYEYKEKHRMVCISRTKLPSDGCGLQIGPSRALASSPKRHFLGRFETMHSTSTDRI